MDQPGESGVNSLILSDDDRKKKNKEPGMVYIVSFELADQHGQPKTWGKLPRKAKGTTSLRIAKSVCIAPRSYNWKADFFEKSGMQAVEGDSIDGTINGVGLMMESGLYSPNAKQNPIIA